jgi:hypothetical protein
MKIPAFTSQKSDDFSATYCALLSTNWGNDFSSFRWGLLLKAVRKAPSRCLDQFPVFELALTKRGRKWKWSVSTSEGEVVMMGSETSRPAAKYRADSALFLLLSSAPYRSIKMSVPLEPRIQPLGREPMKRVARAHKK